MELYFKYGYGQFSMTSKVAIILLNLGNVILLLDTLFFKKMPF